MRTSLSQQIQNSLMFIDGASRKLSKAQVAAVSGKRIQSPSDDVPGTNRSMSLRSAISTSEQLTNNIVVSKPLLGTTINAVQDLIGNVQKVRDIAIAAANPDYSSSARGAYVQELDGILSQMSDIAKTKHTDQYIFSGTKNDQPPIQASMLPAPASPFIYVGDSSTKTTKVLSWVSLPVSIPGDTMFNFNGSAGSGSTDLFKMVDDLKTAIQSGNSTNISGQLDNIDANLNNILSCSARLGTWSSRMDNAQSTLSESIDRFKGMISDIEDVDMTTAVIDLKTQENVYQSALTVTSRMLDLSLASQKFM